MRKHNKTLRSILTGIISLCVAVAFVVCPEADPAFADIGVIHLNYVKKITIMLDPGVDKAWRIRMGKKAKKAKKIQITSSNKKVCNALGDTDFDPEKPGKATLTIKITKKNGKVKKYKTKVTVLAYKNPFREVKMGKYDWTSRYDKRTWRTEVYKKEGEEYTAPFVVTPKKGWKVSKIEYEARYYGGFDRPDIDRTIKSGDEITIYGKGTYYDVNIYITVKNLSSGQKLEFSFEIDNGVNDD